MKWKIATIILTVALVFVGCGENTQSNVSASDVIRFDMQKVSEDFWDNFELYEDTETHIQYIVYKTSDGAAICPRYFRDNGTLYTEAAKE